MSGQLTILHLSDFHFSEARDWDADPILRDLVRQIRDDATAGLVPDVVAFTGDIADRGKASDYAVAAKWIRTRLLPALPADFRSSRLLFVPGNHDVDRSQINVLVQALHKHLLESKDQSPIATVLGDPAQRAAILRPHDAYRAFVSEFRGAPLEVPWWSEVIELEGVRVHFAGLCSSWASSGDGDRGRLLLGRFQVNSVVADAERADLSIALVHHPWDYLAEFDAANSEAAIHRKFRLLLRGHLHTIDSRIIRHADKQCIELAAGAAYSGGDFPNAYQWVVLNSLHQIDVRFRIWSDGRWIADRNQAPSSPDGVVTFPLQSAPATVGAPSPGAPFASLVAELSAGFSGRQFVDRELERWMAAHARGYFIVEGEPGIGKSAWAAHLVETRRCIHHFNVEAEGIVRVDQCQRILCAQLVERYLRDSKPDWSVGFADGELLRRILDCISATLKPEERVLVVVDALDEAALPRPGENALCLPRHLPSGVHFVVTTRPLVDRSLVVDGPERHFVLGADSTENRDDVQRHVESFLAANPGVQQRHSVQYPDSQALSAAITSRSEGNFMYLHYVLPELGRGDLSIDNLPMGLAQYYQSHWQKMKSRDQRKWDEQQAPVLAVLAASAEQISSEEIHTFAKRSRPTLERSQVSTVLDEWRPFLRVTRDQGGKPFYSIYHKSFREFLHAKDAVGDIDLRATNGGIAVVLMQSLDAWKAKSRRGVGD